MSLLILSGFEANGFAGLVKDVTVASQLGLKPSAIATCQSAQSAHALERIDAVESGLLAAQLSSLMQIPTVIKVGLLPDQKTSQTIAQWLAGLATQPYVIVDPVASSSADSQTFSTEPLAKILQPLVPFMDLLTPNTDELNSLIGQSFIERQHSGFRCHQAKVQLLVKGGHAAESDQYVTDRLYDSNARLSAQWCQKRIAVNARGTGCQLSTAIASCCALDYNLLDSITLANAHLNRSLTEHSPLLSIPRSSKHFPSVNKNELMDTALKPFPKLATQRGLYPVVDSAAWISQLADTGIATIQLRIKNKPIDTVKNEIVAAVKVARKKNLQLFINDHWQLAIELGAYGVHLGQEDLQEADLSAIQNAGLRLGISTHGDFEFCLAKQLTPSYLAVGAIYPTNTKDMTGHIQGTERLARYVDMSDAIPVVAIGGINQQRLADVLQTKVPMVAVVSAITKADDPERTARQWQKRIHSVCLQASQ